MIGGDGTHHGAMNPLPAPRRDARAWGLSRAAAFLVGALVVSPDTQAQGAAATSASACASCEIVITRTIARLGRGDRDFQLGRQPAFAVDSGGRIVTGPVETGGFAVFDSAGSLIRRVGRFGGGPLEFRMIAFIAPGPRNSMWIADQLARRMTIVENGYERARSFNLEHAVSDLVPLSDGRALISVPTQDGGPLGQPIRLLSENGGSAGAFGNSTRSVEVPHRFGSARRIAPADGGTVWVTWLDRYRIERWDRTGKQTQVIEPRVTWFPPATSDPVPGQADERKPFPSLSHVYQESDSVLWAVVVLADANWKAASGSSTGRVVERRRLSLAENAPFYDTVIEALDPRTGRVLASVRRDEFFARVRGGPYLARFRSEESGEDVVEIWRYQLVRGPARR